MGMMVHQVMNLRSKNESEIIEVTHMVLWLNRRWTI